jgi:hypothetical protein
MKSVQILLYDTFILLSCALLTTLVPALMGPMVWFSVGLCFLSILVMGMELVASRKRGRLSTTAIVGLITMVAIIGMLSWWILPRYTSYNDPPSSYPSVISG